MRRIITKEQQTIDNFYHGFHQTFGSLLKGLIDDEIEFRCEFDSPEVRVYYTKGKKPIIKNSLDEYFYSQFKEVYHLVLLLKELEKYELIYYSYYLEGLDEYEPDTIIPHTNHSEKVFIGDFFAPSTSIVTEILNFHNRQYNSSPVLEVYRDNEYRTEAHKEFDETKNHNKTTSQLTRVGLTVALVVGIGSPFLAKWLDRKAEKEFKQQNTNNVEAIRNDINTQQKKDSVI